MGSNRVYFDTSDFDATTCVPSVLYDLILSFKTMEKCQVTKIVDVLN